MLSTWNITLITLFTSAACLMAQPDVPLTPANQFDYFKAIELLSGNGYTKQHCYRYELINGTVSNNRYKYRELKFYSDGNIRELIHINNKGLHQSIITFAYNPDKLPKSESEFTPDGKQVGRRVYKYDTQGFLSEVINYNQGSYIISKTVYSKDSSDQSILQKLYSSPTRVQESIKYTYDNYFTGKVIRVDEWEGETNLRFSKQLIYNDELLTEELYRGADGQISYRIFYEYTPQGLLKEAVRENSDETRQIVFTCQYTEEGLLSAYIQYDQYRGIRDYVKYTYD